MPWRIFVWILGGLTLLGVTAGLVILLGVGKWLVREDGLEQATAIAVLSGNTPLRALEAARLYHDGYAKEIWLTHPGATVDALKTLGIEYPREDDVNTRVLRGQGVPANAIKLLESPIVNTSDELDAISATLKARGGQKVIVVTNKAHTRRVHILWSMYFGSRGELITHTRSRTTSSSPRIGGEPREV
ncbi:MAG: YdcF family protein [Candidatus Acidiferrum sp.]